MAINVQIPPLGESVTEAVLLRWIKQDGDFVQTDDPLCELETDKANVELPSPTAGVLKQSTRVGDTVKIGDVIARIDESKQGEASKEVSASKAPTQNLEQSSVSDKLKEAVKDAPFSPSVRRLVRENELDPEKLTGSGPRGRVTKEDVLNIVNKDKYSSNSDVKSASSVTSSLKPRQEIPGERREPMSKIRKKIAERLVKVKQETAMLTTFNEIDMSSVMELREKYKARFQEAHGVSLGLMSFFARATVLSLKEYPIVNASIDGNEIVYHDYVNLGVAVSTDRGLVVPVLRRVEKMSFSEVELEIKRTALAAREGKLNLEELGGGTFTITNGGVFGSLMSTPILNPPQSAILGLHAIQDRPKAVDGKVEIRPLMYVALSYDHRLIDGKDSVRFLVKIKECLEDPARLMLEI